MLLGTYQPLNPSVKHHNRLYDCFREKLDGEYPIFCFPARTVDEFCFRSLLASPCKPEKLILFETEDFVRFDAVSWNAIMMFQENQPDSDFMERFEAMFSDVDERFSEYVVKPAALDDALGEIEIYDLIMNEDFDSIEDEISRVFAVSTQSAAKNMYMNSIAKQKFIPSDKYGDKLDLPALLAMTAFVFYLGASTYQAINKKPSSLIELIPFHYDPKNSSSWDAYGVFQNLRYKIFDTTAESSHDEYLQMAQALEDAVGKARLSALSGKFSRNDLCPCMSGKKFKKCHGAKPIDIFPF